MVLKLKENNIMYRNTMLKAKDLLDMRLLLCLKIEQEFERSSFWSKIMP